MTREEGEAIRRGLAVSPEGEAFLREKLAQIQFEKGGRAIDLVTVDDIKRILWTWDDRRLQDCKNQQLLSILEEEIARRAAAPREEHGVREALVEARQTLDFRTACDAAYVEGQLARSTGLDIGVNPYVGYERAERLCGEGTRRTLQEFHLPWMMGWRAADEQDAVDALLVAAQASTRDGTVTPACPAGEGLREAVAALLARRVKP